MVLYYIKSYHTKVVPIFIMPKIKIVSGGQTGVDRAALDAALASNMNAVAGVRTDGKQKMEKYHPTTLLLNLKILVTQKEPDKMSSIVMEP